MRTLLSTLLLLASLVPSCSDGEDRGPVHCVIDGDTPDFLERVGCEADFVALASEPLDSSIPGARSVKTVVDRMDDDALFFQNSRKYQIHWEFAREHRSGNGLDIVGDLGSFNAVEYYHPERRFILGALTYYEGPGVWAFELSPYDTASSEMIRLAYQKIWKTTPFIKRLRFHPTSDAVQREVKDHTRELDVITSDELFAGIDYQPLNLKRSLGRLRFVRASDLETTYLSFRDIVVLDRVPNDISVVLGIITAEFQTPLAHINVLSQNRRTPNMALRGAMEHTTLRGLEDQWVALDVKAQQWTIKKVTKEEADLWWDENRPPAVQVPDIDLTRTGLWDMSDVLDATGTQREQIRAAIPAFGGKASHYASLAQIEGVPVPRAFAIPVYYYDQFMRQHGFYDRVEQMLAGSGFEEPAVRDQALAQLRADMESATVDATLLAQVHDKLAAEYPGLRMRFRSSTNAEDLDGFTGAGLYTSKSGDPSDPDKTVEDAIRTVWASVWFFRAFEERSYRSISHREVGMALLVHRSFPNEFANGVALTANLFDMSGLDPAFYINVQRGESSVVKPAPGVTTDQILYYYNRPGQPAAYQGHSNLVNDGETVLDNVQLYAVGQALQAIHTHFLQSYGPPPSDPTAWYAMDVEFKLSELVSGGPIELQVKQARPHPGRGQ